MLTPATEAGTPQSVPVYSRDGSPTEMNVLSVGVYVQTEHTVENRYSAVVLCEGGPITGSFRGMRNL